MEILDQHSASRHRDINVVIAPQRPQPIGDVLSSGVLNLLHLHHVVAANYIPLIKIRRSNFDVLHTTQLAHARQKAFGAGLHSELRVRPQKDKPEYNKLDAACPLNTNRV